jgi:hypothetical protein
MIINQITKNPKKPKNLIFHDFQSKKWTFQAYLLKFHLQ